MSLVIQSNASGDWLAITTLSLANGATIQLGINNDEASAKTARLWVAGVGNLDPASVVDRQGKEIITEGWLQCKLPTDSVWVPLKFPSSFPATFAELGAIDGVFTLTAGASTRTLIDFRMVHGATPTTTGEARFVPCLRWL